MKNIDMLKKLAVALCFISLFNQCSFFGHHKVKIEEHHHPHHHVCSHQPDTLKKIEKYIDECKADLKDVITKGGLQFFILNLPHHHPPEHDIHGIDDGPFLHDIHHSHEHGHPYNIHGPHSVHPHHVHGPNSIHPHHIHNSHPHSSLHPPDTHSSHEIHSPHGNLHHPDTHHGHELHDLHDLHDSLHPPDTHHGHDTHNLHNIHNSHSSLHPPNVHHGHDLHNLHDSHDSHNSAHILDSLSSVNNYQPHDSHLHNPFHASDSHYAHNFHHDSSHTYDYQIPTDHHSDHFPLPLVDQGLPDIHDSYPPNHRKTTLDSQVMELIDLYNNLQKNNANHIQEGFQTDYLQMPIKVLDTDKLHENDLHVSSSYNAMYHSQPRSNVPNTSNKHHLWRICANSKGYDPFRPKVCDGGKHNEPKEHNEPNEQNNGKPPSHIYFNPEVDRIDRIFLGDHKHKLHDFHEHKFHNHHGHKDHDYHDHHDHHDHHDEHFHKEHEHDEYSDHHNSDEHMKAEFDHIHPAVVSSDEKRIAGCLLHCLYAKNNAVNNIGWPTLDGLVHFYSDGVQEHTYFMATLRAVDVCLKKSSLKYHVDRSKHPEIVQSCDLAFDVFDCVSDKINEFCTEQYYYHHE